MKYSRIISTFYSVIMIGLLYLYSRQDLVGHGEGVYLPGIISFPGGMILAGLYSKISYDIGSLMPDKNGIPSSLVPSSVDNWIYTALLFIGGFIQYYYLGRAIDLCVDFVRGNKAKKVLKDEVLYEMPEDLRDPK